MKGQWFHRMRPSYANGLFVGFASFYVFLEVTHYISIGPGGLAFG